MLGDRGTLPMWLWLLVCLLGLASSGCTTSDNDTAATNSLVEAVQAEKALTDPTVYRQHRDGFVAAGNGIVPFIERELQGENASGDVSSANRLRLYLEVLTRLRARDAHHSIEQLLERATDEDVQLAAVEALAILGDHGSSTSIRAALNSPHPAVRTEAARVAGILVCDDAIPELVKLLDERAHVGPPTQAAAALHRLTGELHGEDAAAWRRWLASRR